MQIFRCFVEKRPGFDTEAKALRAELAEFLGVRVGVRIFNRYDVAGVSREDWPDVVNTVLSEPMCDDFFEELPPLGSSRLLHVEPLPAQFNARADSCEQCVQMLLGGARPRVKTAWVYAFEGIDNAAFARVKAYLINPLEHREASEEMPTSLEAGDFSPQEKIALVDGFIGLDKPALEDFRAYRGLAMSLDDALLVQKYFAAENRDPTETELRVIDTYWSDHCRHTTFNTIIHNAEIGDPRVKAAYELFLSVNGDREPTLMRIATAAARHFHAVGKLPMLDISDENNACAIRIGDMLLYFKNETHNHPTEIEPFGGASTCIGGAIRDPLSGRAYVYQAMRISGAGSPFGETIPGKLPQRKISIGAAEGYSSYGNQIGLATGFVKEIYHEGYVAKRMEVGAVVAAAPVEHVRRETPAAGDVVILLGGRTGRDGIGGATGSSKTHDASTVETGAAEVQKGNAPEERKIQRLFRDPAVTRLIKKCNDFGAGGVAVAIGELADGLEIDLDAVPLKNQNLDGTEIAISESQERMAVVVAQTDAKEFLHRAQAENIEATIVAHITTQKRLVMHWRNEKIVDIDRAFLDTNGAARQADIKFSGALPPNPHPLFEKSGAKTVMERILTLCANLNFCSQKGLVERFDASIGAGSVFNPFGGKHALTETQVMAAKLPGGGRTASVMAYGFDPFFTEADPFGGSAFAVVTSVAKLVAAGAELDTVHLSLQEYFPRVDDDPARWGVVFAAMLGAFSAQMGLEIAAIGGKDSMSGSFDTEDARLDVPPTLISFAVGIGDAARLVSPEFKTAGNPVYLLETPMRDGLPDYAALRAAWEKYAALLASGKILSAWACDAGVYSGIIKMSLGNMLGFTGAANENFFNREWSSIIFEATEEIDGFTLLGHTINEPQLTFGETTINLSQIRTTWESPLEPIFPISPPLHVQGQGGLAPLRGFGGSAPKVFPLTSTTKIATPKAVIPVFPGTNCEYDTATAIERAGGVSEIVLVRNLSPAMLEESVVAMERAIRGAQMLVFPGGFSGADEPDGSGKFIVSFFRNPRLVDAVHGLLERQDGLILGICNGFQALVKLGLLPGGRISQTTADSPTLARNYIGRHQARYVLTRVASADSPWLSECKPGEIFLQPVSHGEGRFTAPPDVLEKIAPQIAFQYVDFDGNPSQDIEFNPNGSAWAIEGIFSPCGRVLGKMAHTERVGEFVAKNFSETAGKKYLPLFEGGVNYFK